MITLFEQYKSKADADYRKMPEIVLCIKNNKKFRFEKNNIYFVDGCYGDPQGASEIYGAKFMIMECVNKILIKNDLNKKIEFRTKNYSDQIGWNIGWNKKEYEKIPYFFDFFEIPEFEQDIKNFNL